jgi:hypothetical protein
MDLRRYAVNSDSFWLNEDERYPWVDAEVQDVFHSLRWSHYYMIGLLQAYPSRFTFAANRYLENGHWWHELCNFTSNLMADESLEEGMLRNI